jgi:hypothetical protein
MVKMVMVTGTLLSIWRLREISKGFLIFSLVREQILQLKVVMEKRFYSWLKNVIM